MDDDPNLNPLSSSPESTSEQPAYPIALRARHDGWTAARQIAFIGALAESGCVEEACRHVGMSRQGAYALRRHPDGALFRDAWDSAVDYALYRLEDAAIGRALNGVARPIFYKGEQVGEVREHDERLTMFLLRYRRPARYGAWLDREPPADDGRPALTDPSAAALDQHLREIADLADLFDDQPDENGATAGDPARTESPRA